MQEGDTWGTQISQTKQRMKFLIVDSIIYNKDEDAGAPCHSHCHSHHKSRSDIQTMIRIPHKQY